MFIFAVSSKPLFVLSHAQRGDWCQYISEINKNVWTSMKHRVLHRLIRLQN